MSTEEGDSVSRREEFLGFLKSWRDEQDSDNTARQQIDLLLSDLKLYPFTPVIELGIAGAELLEKTPEEAVNITLQLAASEEKATRAVSTVILSRLARFHPKIWMELAKHLAADSDWEVREYTAHIFDVQGQFEGLAAYHLDYVFEVLGSWVKDENYLVRRAPTNALLSYYLKNPEIGERLIALLDPLLDDLMEYVQRNHIFALRTIGKKRPELVFDYMESKLPQLTDNSRQTLRQVLEHKFADKVPARKKELLAKLHS
jgi:3-methyladenine DNA glycosylase AlkD